MSGGHRQPRYPQAPVGYPPPPSYPWPNHPEAVFVNQAPRESTSVTRLTIPVVLAVSVAAFLVVGSYAVAVQFTELRHAIERVNDKLDSFRTDLASRIERVEGAAWTKTDQQIFCSTAERVNTGWRCTEGTAPFRRDVPKMDGWKPKG